MPLTRSHQRTADAAIAVTAVKIEVENCRSMVHVHLFMMAVKVPLFLSGLINQTNMPETPFSQV